mmetsp:Transcript_18071/g.47589  ORF Transcript_18071/g.47589 Transcript_18071/m.47589 type:complete len:201 (-) Transcript_18071:58-660(-)
MDCTSASTPPRLPPRLPKPLGPFGRRAPPPLPSSSLNMLTVGTLLWSLSSDTEALPAPTTAWPSRFFFEVAMERYTPTRSRSQPQNERQWSSASALRSPRRRFSSVYTRVGCVGAASVAAMEGDPCPCPWSSEGSCCPTASSTGACPSINTSCRWVAGRSTSSRLPNMLATTCGRFARRSAAQSACTAVGTSTSSGPSKS